MANIRVVTPGLVSGISEASWEILRSYALPILRDLTDSYLIDLVLVVAWMRRDHHTQAADEWQEYANTHYGTLKIKHCFCEAAR